VPAPKRAECGILYWRSYAPTVEKRKFACSHAGLTSGRSGPEDPGSAPPRLGAKHYILRLKAVHKIHEQTDIGVIGCWLPANYS
jgi:hypothetical protein